MGLFHSQGYHKRYFVLEFGQPYCYFYEKKGKEKHYKAHLQTSLRSAAIMEDAEVAENRQRRENERSKSLLKRLMRDEVGRCNWNFPFNVSFEEKTYELYAPTRADREQWVHILGAIAEMNQEGVKLEGMTPFDYIKEKELVKQRVIEESKMTQSARDKAGQHEAEKQLFEQVHIWLRLNQELM